MNNASSTYLSNLLSSMKQTNLKEKETKMQGSSPNLSENVANLQSSVVSQPTVSIYPDSKFSNPLVSSKVKYSLFIGDSTHYESVKAQVDRLDQEIGQNWLDQNPEIQAKVEKHQELANAMLMYEIEHDLLPL